MGVVGGGGEGRVRGGVGVGQARDELGLDAGGGQIAFGEDVAELGDFELGVVGGGGHCVCVGGGYGGIWGGGSGGDEGG